MNVTEHLLWKLAEECAELEKDAARYRWLRSMHPIELGLLVGYEAGRSPDLELDLAIDGKRNATV